MALENPSFIYDSESNIVRPVSTSTWTGLASTTWDNWKEWTYSQSTQIIYCLDNYFFGFPYPYVNFKIKCTSTGLMSYKVYTTDGTLGDANTTEYVISQGATSIPAFNARTITIMAYCNKIGDVAPTISQLSIDLVQNSATEIQIPNIDTSILDGSQTARVIPLNGADISTITDIRIVPKETASPYNLDVYVTNTPTSTYLIPKVISKTVANPTFALVGVDNQPRDGVVDIIIKALPRYYMDGNNVTSS
jgi:hypothetical protein